MAEAGHLGNNLGFIYRVAPDRTSIQRSYPNTPENAKRIMVEALSGRSIAINQSGSGTITVDTVTGVGSITAITINGYDQIGAAIPFTGATSTDVLAALINTAINGFSNGTIYDYTSIVSGSVVTLVSNTDIGTTDNGALITPVITANATTTDTNISGGSDTTTSYNAAYGYTWFLNADYDASGCSGEGSAVEDSLTNALNITEYVIPRAFNSAIDKQTVSISSGAVTVARKNAVSLFYIGTESSAGTDDLDTIGVTSFAEGDIIVIRGESSSEVVTVKDATGNIYLQGDVDFVTADFETALTLQLKGSNWYELSRTTQTLGDVADYRTAGFGQFGINTFNTAATATSGTVTFNGGTDSKEQVLTGTATLTGNTSYALGTGVNGDEFWLSFDSAITLGGFTLDIFGITLTSTQALNGGLMFYGKYSSGAWRGYMMPNLSAGLTNTFVASSEFYGASSVDVAAVETTLKTETITRRVSFESGEECDNQIKMSYPGTVTELYFTVDKVIAGTDNGTIQAKNNAGTSMTAGLITVTAASALDTGFSVSPSANNTFIAGDILNFTSAKTTKGGFGTLSIKVAKS